MDVAIAEIAVGILKIEAARLAGDRPALIACLGDLRSAELRVTFCDSDEPLNHPAFAGVFNSRATLWLGLLFIERERKLSGLARNFGDVFAVRLGGEGAVGVVGGDAFEYGVQIILGEFPFERGHTDSARCRSLPGVRAWNAKATYSAALDQVTGF